MMLSSGLDENSITQHLALKTSFTASVETRDHPSCSDLSRVKYGDCIENLAEMLKSVDLPTDASLVSTEYRIRTFLEKSTKVAYLYYTWCICIYKLSGGLTSYIFLCLYIIRSIRNTLKSSTTEAGKTLEWKGDPDVPYCVRGRPKFLQEQGLDCGSSGPSVHRMQRINIHCFDGFPGPFTLR